VKKVVVIGSGISGMSAAAFLAKSGFQVTVIEKNDQPGGRCRTWEKDGFLFDMGPSWYWMPDVFDRFFESFGKKVSDYYRLDRLNPSYKVVFSENNQWEIPATAEKLGDYLEQFEAGAKEKLNKFLSEAAYKYRVGINKLVFKPGRKLNELLDAELIQGIFKLDVFNSISSHIKSMFKNEQIIQLLEFPVLFLGAKPEDTPALYSLMNHADISLGTWYPQGGMHQISKAMESLCLELGVDFKYNEAVVQIHKKGKEVVSVESKQTNYPCDAVIGSADYNHLDKDILKSDRNYSDAYWNKKVMAPSSLIFYLGVDKKLNNILHHNLFFDADFKGHAKEIYDTPQWPKNPLFYVCCPSKTDDSVAPAGKENLFILIPVAPALDDPENTRERYYNLVMERLEKICGENIRNHVVVKRSYAHSNFIEDYHSFKGNAYGLANTLLQTAHLKPKLKNKNLKNFYYTGQLTVPGPGLPPALISGEVVANELIKEIKQ
jgi:phytoene desaturase